MPNAMNPCSLHRIYLFHLQFLIFLDLIIELLRSSFNLGGTRFWLIQPTSVTIPVAGNLNF